MRFLARSSQAQRSSRARTRTPEVADGEAGPLPIGCARNFFGRQTQSFEATLDGDGPYKGYEGVRGKMFRGSGPPKRRLKSPYNSYKLV